MITLITLATTSRLVMQHPVCQGLEERLRLRQVIILPHHCCFVSSHFMLVFGSEFHGAFSGVIAIP